MDRLQIDSKYHERHLTMMVSGNNLYLAARAKRPLLVFSIVPRIAQSGNIFFVRKIERSSKYNSIFYINEHGRLRQSTYLVSGDLRKHSGSPAGQLSHPFVFIVA